MVYKGLKDNMKEVEYIIVNSSRMKVRGKDRVMIEVEVKIKIEKMKRRLYRIKRNCQVNLEACILKLEALAVHGQQRTVNK